MGALLVNLSLVVGEFARTGWLPYPPLSELTYSPGVGVDYYLWAIQISGIGTLMTGINLVTTILKMRAPGMSYMRMPVFCWTALASSLLIVAAFPVLTATLAMLLLDRYLDFHFFTNAAGGNAMMFMNLIWAWGHPEVYILVLPAFGVYSEVVATFSGKPLFGYRSMVIATMAICILSFTVWLHHFFTMGAGADVNAFFGIASMLIAIPTGVKIYNWLFTMYGGRVRFSSPMLWAIGFMVTFVVGGMTGVLLAVPPADFVLHNSLFLVAHFHNVIIGGVVFGAFAGYTFWFPKAFGFTLDERLGKAAFWCWFVGFYVAFVPLYVVGLEGMTRRMQHYDRPEWHPWLLVAWLGALIILCGIALQVAQLAISIRSRERRREPTGDPWDGRSLEWATPSPPPAFNFAVLPNVTRRGALLECQAASARADAPGHARAALRAHRDAAQQSGRLRHGVPRGRDRLLPHLAHLVAGRARACLAPTRPSSSSPGAMLPSSRFPPRKSRGSTAPIARRAPNPCASSAPRHAHEYRGAARAADPYPLGTTPGGRACAADGDRAWRRRTGAQAHRRRVRLLDLPALRRDHVLEFLRRLRGALQEHRRRPCGTAAVRSAQYGGGDRLPSRLDLYLRDGESCGRSTQSEVDPARPPCHRTPRPRIHHARGSRVRQLGWHAAPVQAAAPSCPPSSPWWDATACT